MTSERQRAANRANAKRSTGPRTAAGKAASRRNAYRHGLAARQSPDSEQERRTEALAEALAGAHADATRLFHARIAAEAMLELAAIRAMRARVIDAASDGDPLGADPPVERSDSVEGRPTADMASAFTRAVPSLMRLERYERRAASRRRMALRRIEAAGEESQG